jgi:hypothetical protein
VLHEGQYDVLQLALRASAEASRTSAHRAKASPPPMQTPWTIATSGFSNRVSASKAAAVTAS